MSKALAGAACPISGMELQDTGQLVGRAQGEQQEWSEPMKLLYKDWQTTSRKGVEAFKRLKAAARRREQSGS